MYSLVVVISSLKFNVERQHLNHITATDTFYGIFTVSYGIYQSRYFWTINFYIW